MMNSDNESTVYWSREDNGIAILTINRPDKLNALNLEVKNLIEQGIRELDSDDSVKVIILTGAGGVFVAGTDVAEMVDMQPDDHEKLGTGKVFEALRECTKPMIAAVEKYALGGGMELALACDLIIAGEDAQFAQPEIKVGVMPGAGGTQLLLRAIGKYQTMRLVLTGERIPAARALSMGLLSEMVESGKALDTAMTLAATIASMPPLSVAAIKQVIKQGQELPLSEALRTERQTFVDLFATEDQAEGMRAFLEKRKADFKGK